jgi:hypothetical protein
LPDTVLCLLFCCSFFRSQSEKTNNRYNDKYRAAVGNTVFESATA